MDNDHEKPTSGTLAPAEMAAALVIVGLTVAWFIIERNFESLIAMIAAFSGLFSYASLKNRRVNWLMAVLVVLVALGGLLLVREPTTETAIPKVSITQISYEGIGKKEPNEFVEIRNEDINPINLRGWTLSDQSNNEFLFPNFNMNPRSVCRIYTNQSHLDWCGFNFNSDQAIWDNVGDCAFLRDLENRLVDGYCYP